MTKTSTSIRRAFRSEVLACDALAHAANLALADLLHLLVNMERGCEEIARLHAVEGFAAKSNAKGSRALLGLKKAEKGLRPHLTQLGDLQWNAMEALSSVVRDHRGAGTNPGAVETFVSVHPSGSGGNRTYSRISMGAPANQSQFVALPTAAYATQLLDEITRDIQGLAAESRKAMFEIDRLALLAGFERRPRDWTGNIGSVIFAEFWCSLEQAITALHNIQFPPDVDLRTAA